MKVDFRSILLVLLLVTPLAHAQEAKPATRSAADGFMQMIYALQKLGATGFANHTELRIAVWPEDWNAQVPIQSLWYMGVDKGPGWANARKDQTDYYNATGEFVPVIKINLPASLNDDFRFSYYDDDQAVSPPKK